MERTMRDIQVLKTNVWLIMNTVSYVRDECCPEWSKHYNYRLKNIVPFLRVRHCIGENLLNEVWLLCCSKGSIYVTLLLNISSNAEASADQVTGYVASAIRNDIESGGLLAKALAANFTLEELSCTAGCSHTLAEESTLNVCTCLTNRFSISSDIIM